MRSSVVLEKMCFLFISVLAIPKIARAIGVLLPIVGVCGAMVGCHWWGAIGGVPSTKPGSRVCLISTPGHL